MKICLGIFFAWITFIVVVGNPDAKRLYDELLLKNDYNKLIRPVDNNSDTLTVFLGLKLSQLIDVDEKNQIMTTNVWVRQEWRSNTLKWDPRKFGGLKFIYVPSDLIWIPDIVLFNNADGNYEVTLMTKATLHYDGKVIWEPPAIYKSSCTIDVEFFPFDEQECAMKFGSWTYDGNQVDLKHLLQINNSISGPLLIDYGIDLGNFYDSVEWDILKAPAQRNEKSYPCCQELYPDITFNVTLRRKTLFYTVNLIIPCVAISFLTVLVFYLPSDSGEKITLCISILLSLTVFFLLLAEIIPPTSLVVPLIGKYLLFTMILVTLSIIVTVVVLNVHFRSPATHTMSPWVRKVFIHTLPKLLLIQRPNIELEVELSAEENENGDVEKVMEDIEEIDELMNVKFKAPSEGRTRKISALGRTMATMSAAAAAMDRHWSGQGHRAKNTPFRNLGLPGTQMPFQFEVESALDGVRFIAQHLRDQDHETSIKEDWKYVAMVLDRLFLWVFTIACVVGTLGIILQAPTLYDDRAPLTSTNLPLHSNIYKLKS